MYQELLEYKNTLTWFKNMSENFADTTLHHGCGDADHTTVVNSITEIQPHISSNCWNLKHWHIQHQQRCWQELSAMPGEGKKKKKKRHGLIGIVCHFLAYLISLMIQFNGSILGIYWKELKCYVYKHTHTHTFIDALLKFPNTGK